MSKTAQTPGPWHAPSAGIYAEDGTFIASCGGRRQVRSIEGRRQNAVAEIAANARFIALACNSHEELLAACEATRQYWEACAKSARDTAEEASHPGCHVCKDTPELQKLANSAAERVYAAIANATP